MLGFVDAAPPPPPRQIVAPPVVATAPLVPHTGASRPVRSTTTLVRELWEAEPDDPTPFPPPVTPEERAIRRGGGLVRAFVTLTLLAGLGAGSYLGVGWWLSERHESMVAESVDALAVARTNAGALVGAGAIVADPGADAVALSDVSLGLVALDGDAQRLGALSHPPSTWIERVLPLDDPLAAQRGTYRVLADHASALSAELGAALTARLAAERLPDLPVLPAGADPATVEATTVQLAGVLTDLDATSAMLAPRFAAVVASRRDALGETIEAYVKAIGSSDPAAEGHAATIRGAHGALRPALLAEAANAAADADDAATTYRATLLSAGG
jgi:hypothetical protein